MFKNVTPCLLSASVLLFTQALAQSSCSASFTPKYPTPSLASGFQARLIATGLTSPRDIIFDASGNLLVVEAGRGISSHSIAGGSGCVSVASSHDVVVDSSLNHGIAFSVDGRTLYASNPDNVYAWPYDAGTSRTTAGSTTIINGMTGTDHTSRTLAISRKVPGMLIVNRGSLSNLDVTTEDINSGLSQVKAFNVSGVTSPMNYASSGRRLGWGLRNDVGVREHPVTGGIWTVENSVDEMVRDGVDIHQNNPGEELNFLGYLDGTPYAAQGSNFGYPGCFAAWNVSEIPNPNGLQVGQQFAIGNQNATLNDTYCRNSVTPPRLVFQAHMAPLDILFDAAGTSAYITFHGSWDRTQPVGYMLTRVAFANGQPVEPSTSTTAAIPIMVNQDTSRCPGSCFRPVGLAFDSQGRLYMSSDATGEIYVITAANGAGIAGAAPSGSATTSAGSATPTSATASTLTGPTGTASGPTEGPTTGGSTSATGSSSGGSTTVGTPLTTRSSTAASATGGSSTGGSTTVVTPVTISSSTRSSATGGSSTGASATATGGSSSGASATGGSSAGASTTASAGSSSSVTTSSTSTRYTRTRGRRPPWATGSGTGFEQNFGAFRAFGTLDR